MKKRWNKLIALLMLSCMITASFPMYQVNAEENSTMVTDENVTSDNSDQDMQEESINEQLEDDSATDENDVKSEETEMDSNSDFEESVIEKNQNQINYVFVETPYLESPGIERIAVSYGDGSETIQSLSMIVESEDGEREVWNSSDNVNNLYLFEKEYTDESQTGTYAVIGFNLLDESGTHKVKLSDYGMEALFGVNEEYEGIEELQPLDEDMVETQALEQEDSACNATVVQIDSENPTKSVKEIESALEDAEENVDSESGIAETSALSEVSEYVRSVADVRSNDGNVVVALDPGHDSKHTGATGIGGLKEEVLTLKIANYCKEELEKYAGVSVYMTRTTASCPYPSNKNSGGDIGDRVQAAVNAGADLFVSFHLNSSGSSGSKGAEVIVPNNNWKPQVASEGRELAQAILNELKSVGVSMRPTSIYSKDTTISEYYDDGSKSDYFSVQIYAKEAGIPGIIVEHAFLTNSGDVNNFLNSEAGLQKLGVADATGIAKYLGVSKKSVDTGWRTINGEAYYYINGKPVTGEKQIEGHWYYFDKNGTMQKGFVDLGHKVVYYNAKGWMLYGEQQINGHWYYFDTGSGAMKIGFVDLGHKVVYYNKYGWMLCGERQICGHWYYFDTGSGAMQTNKIINGKYYDKKGRYQEIHKILGNPTTTVKKMTQYYNDRNVSYPTAKLSAGGADSIEKLAKIFYEEATAEGIDPAIAWCQTMKETNWLRFGGQVKIEQFNFAGIGATDGGAAGADFSSYGTNGVRMGVRAQIQHLKAYAVSGLKKTDLKNDCVDPRFAYVKKGSAAYVEWLGIQENPTGAGWATDAEYGYSIMKDYVKKLWAL